MNEIRTIKSDDLIRVAKISVFGRSVFDRDVEASRREVETWRSDGDTNARFEVVEICEANFEYLPEFEGF